MEIKRGHVYIVDFNPRVRTKPGKLRPAVVLQSDLVNEAGYPLDHRHSDNNPFG